MKIGLGGGEINAFRRGNYADIDESSAGCWDKGVKYFVVVDKEVNMEPKGVSEYYFGELVGSTLNGGIFGWFGDGRFSNQFSKQFKISLVGVTFFKLIGEQLFFKHKCDKLVFSISNDDNVNLFSNNLVLHSYLYIIKKMEIESPHPSSVKNYYHS